MTDLNENLKQLPLQFATHNCMGREDFMVSDCNREAYQMIEAWPNWLGSGLFIYGPKGCGKSHLAHLFVDRVRAMSAKPIKTEIIAASSVHMRSVKRLAEENTAIVVENVTPKNHNEALFHLFNLFNTEGKYMLWTAENAPNQMNFPLKDLATRLKMLPCVKIAEPDDVMLQMLIVKLFDDRQLKISPEILNYIINNAPRSFAYIESLVAEIDKISLAYQASVNYTIIKQAMDWLALRDNREPDLFEDC
jgi:chromosomal replication initiation ATPase DnaA